MIFNKICVVCGKEFSTHLPNKITCSHECQKIRNRQMNSIYKHNHKPKNHPKNYSCVICGKPFTPKYFGQKYCSDICHNHPAADKLRSFFTKFFHLMEE